MRYSVVHDGIPLGFVELGPGELVAGALAPLSALEPLRGTIRAGSNALLTLGFFGAATVAGQNGIGAALRAAAALQFDLVTDQGELAPATFVNLIEAPDGGVVVLARFGHAHAAVTAPTKPAPRRESAHERPEIPDQDL